MSFMERLQSAMILKTSMYHPSEAEIVEHPHRSFLEAIQRGRKSTVESMILKGLDVDHREGVRLPALLQAIKYERYEIATLLLQYGATANVSDHNGETALHLTTKMHMNEMTHLLIRYGADPAQPDSSGITPLAIVQQQDSSTTLEILTSTEAMPITSMTLFEAASAGDLPALIAVKAPLNKLFEKNRRLQTLLHLAVGGGNIRLLCYLLNKGLNVDSTDRNGDTPLLIATGIRGRSDVIEFLLMRHATIDHKNNIGNLPLTLALTKGHAEHVDVLLNNGANIHVFDGIHTPLTLIHVAIQRFADDATAFRKIESRLLIKGAHVDIPTNRLKWTPLIHASTRQQDLRTKQQLDLLLHLGADVNYTDANGRTALMLACSTGRREAVDRLLDNYSNIDKIDDYGWSALMFGVYYNHHPIVEALLRFGADVNTRSQRGLNALQIAIEHQRQLMIDLLMDYGATIEDENKE